MWSAPRKYFVSTGSDACKRDSERRESGEREREREREYKGINAFIYSHARVLLRFSVMCVFVCMDGGL
jgi:hypothetical protein